MEEEQASTGTESQSDQQEAETIDTPSTATASGMEAAPTKENSFFDPSQLSDELKPQWKKMHGAYTKKMQQFAETSKKASIVDQFNSDPQFAIATIQQRALQLGYSLSKAQAADIASGQATMPGTGQKAPESLITAIRSRLSPELQFMATDLAESAWVTQQALIEPMKQDQAKRDQEEWDAEYEEQIARLSEKHPGWEAHEDDMDEMMKFIDSKKLTHPKFGSKPELIYKLVTGDGAAIAEAASRMGNAARNRVNTGMTNRTSIPNIDERVRKAPTTSDAWEIAKAAARELAAKQGLDN